MMTVSDIVKFRIETIPDYVKRTEFLLCAVWQVYNAYKRKED